MSSTGLKRWREAGQHWRWQQHPVFYRQAGQGVAVLLIHGYPVGSYDWHRIWQPLAEQLHLIAPDMLGMGFSSKPRDWAYSIAQHAQMHEDVLLQLGVERVHVVAFDLGVSVLQEMLAQRHENPLLRRVKIASIMLLNGGVCPQAYRPRWIQHAMASPIGPWLGPRLKFSRFEKSIRSLFSAAHPPSQELLEDFWNLLTHAQGLRVQHQVGRFWKDRVSQSERLIQALLGSGKALRLINGAADPNSGWHMVQALQRHTPKLDVIKLADIGHWPQLEAPERTAQEILRFVFANA
jgi:pimeloyl-ACP methyl ester carboxylesterase